MSPGPARVALVTGAGRGIGRLLTIGLADAGVAVGVLGRDEAALAPVTATVRDRGGSAHPVVADVRDLAAVERAVAEVEHVLGPVDLLVNNAGVIDPVEVPVWEADPVAWWDVVETDLRGPFHLVRAVVPAMLARGGGRVVDLNSGAGANDRDVYSAYCAAKAGLFRIGGNLHLAGYARGLRSFEVAPGVIRTDMTQAMPLHDGRTEWTDPQALVDLVTAVARGDLDSWSGCFLRAGLDTPASLAAAGEPLVGDDGAVPYPYRRLLVHPYGADDPLSPLRRV